MEALGRQGFPVPKVHCLCEDDAVVGTAFYLMDCVDGRIIWVSYMPDADRADRSATFDAMNATLAQLHSYDPQAIGLGGFRQAGQLCGSAGGHLVEAISRLANPGTCRKWTG